MMTDAAEGTMTYATTYMVGEPSQPQMILPDLIELDAAMVVDAGTATSSAATVTATSTATSAHHQHSSVLLGRPVMGLAGNGGSGAVQVIGSGGGGGGATVQLVGGGGAVQLVGGGGSMVHVPPGSRFVVLNRLGTPVGTLDASGRMTALNSDGSGDASLGVVLVGSPMPTHSNNNSSSNISTSNNNSCGIDTSGGGLTLPLGTVLASAATNNAVAAATDAGGVVTSLCGGGVAVGVGGGGGGDSGVVGKRPSSGGGGGSKVKIKREAEVAGPSSSVRSSSARSSGHRSLQSGGRRRHPSASSILPIPYNPMDSFPHHHHLTKTQVEGLFMVLGPHYTNPGRRAPLKDFVLASLVLLSTKDSYREMSERMVFKSRGWMHKTIHLFCQLLVKHLSCLVEWPSGDDLKECLRGFQLIAGVPGVIGAMDSCHMAITKAPVGKSSSFYSNPMQFHSIHLLAVADHRSKFTYINVGRPGSFHESKVFKRSSLCQIIEGEPLGIFPEKTHIIADSAFPLSDYVLTPYSTGSNSNDTALSNSGGNLPRHQKQFNAKVLLTRQPVALAFSVLRAKWQRLKCLEMQRVTNMSIAIKTCCILHNICVYNNGYTHHQAAAPAGGSGGTAMEGGEGCDEERVTVEVEYDGPSPYSSLRKRDMIALYMEGQQVPWGEA